MISWYGGNVRDGISENLIILQVGKWAEFPNKISRMKIMFQADMEDIKYLSPALEVQEIYTDVVLCQSTTEEVEFGDGEW